MTTDLRARLALSVENSVFPAGCAELSLRSPEEVVRKTADAVLAEHAGGDAIEAACKEAYVELERHLGRTVPLREAAPTFAAITAAAPILLAHARAKALEEAAKHFEDLLGPGGISDEIRALAGSAGR